MENRVGQNVIRYLAMLMVVKYSEEGLLQRVPSLGILESVTGNMLSTP